MNNEFTAGDPVDCLLFGKGVIESVDKSKPCPVGVRFPNINGTRWYTEDGRFWDYSNIMLTKGQWQVEQIFPEVRFCKGELVWANLCRGKGWQIFEYDSKGIFHTILYPDKSVKERTLHYVSRENIRKFEDNPYTNE